MKYPGRRCPALPVILLLALLLTGCGNDRVREESASPAPTPGAAQPAIPPTAPPDYTGKLRISEVMVKNRASLADEKGDFPDWIELENLSAEPLDLAGCGLSDRAPLVMWVFPTYTLQPGERAVILCGEERTGFELSPGESLTLTGPDGSVLDQLSCDCDAPDRSLARQPDGSFAETVWISPWFENSPQGYEDYSRTRTTCGLCLSEIAVANDSLPLGPENSLSDWVEIENRSEQSLSLAGCVLTEKRDEEGWPFPDRSLEPGERLLLRCDGDSPADGENTGFSLGAGGQTLYLLDGQGALLDYVYLHDLPADGSLGRGEEGGFLYYTQPSPGEENGEGVRRVSAAPAALTPDGCYEGTESLELALSAPGQIRYTLDGSVPDESSPAYEGPLTISRTTILRAVSREEGALESPTVTYSYFLNEAHSLPTLSLVVDDAYYFRGVYDNNNKGPVLDANLALYDGDHSFNHRCGVSMKGWTSLSLPKKSLGVTFSGRYGGALEADIYGRGLTEYEDLSIRAGQDYTFAVIRNELVQELCLENSESLLTQRSKYCALYINGAYHGLYCLKEDLDRQFYASRTGVSKHSVEMLRFPVLPDTDFYKDVMLPVWNRDMSVQENYDEVAAHLDLDSLIDWILFEGWCGNTDLQGNTRVYRSPENGGKWTFALYDLDWSFWYENTDFVILLGAHGNSGEMLPALANGLLKNEQFRTRCLERYAQLIRGPLSNEALLARIDEMAAYVEPEVARDRERWGLRFESWHHEVEGLKRLITEMDWDEHSITNLCYYLRLDREEREAWFG